MTPQEKSKIIFEALFPDECWHEADKWHCKKCGANLHDVYRDTGELDGHPNYFDPKLPDDERVKLVDWAYVEFGVEVVHKAVHNMPWRANVLGYPAFIIAEAIYSLIVEVKQ